MFKTTTEQSRVVHKQWIPLSWKAGVWKGRTRYDYRMPWSGAMYPETCTMSGRVIVGIHTLLGVALNCEGNVFHELTDDEGEVFQYLRPNNGERSRNTSTGGGRRISKPFRVSDTKLRQETFTNRKMHYLESPPAIISISRRFLSNAGINRDSSHYFCYHHDNQWKDLCDVESVKNRGFS